MTRRSSRRRRRRLGDCCFEAVQVMKRAPTGRRSMSDKPEEEQQGARKHQPSFEEILQGVQVEEPKPPAAPKRSAQPTFEEILESARPASESPKPQQQGKSRPPRQKEERKMPIVVRKPTLGAPAVSGPPAQHAENAAQKTAEDPGSVY